MNAQSGQTRLNLGCGACPTPGWLNYDNSLTVLLSRYSRVISAGRRLGLWPEPHATFLRIAAETPIKWANVTRRIPADDGSVDVLYTSHMLEHLSPSAAAAFLQEAGRVLKVGGVIRIAVPDLALFVAEYTRTGNADTFIERTLLAQPQPKTLASKLRWLVVGQRGHLWMYDGDSLTHLLSRQGFCDPRVLPTGTTTLSQPGELNLREREEESLYVEAQKC